MDGWALTMLSRENVGYASTCNSVGQTAGYFMGNVLFLALESPDFCNKYLRAEPRTVGIVTLSGRELVEELVEEAGGGGGGRELTGPLLKPASALSSAPDFLFFWGVVFLVSTTLVAILKRESVQGGGPRRVHEEPQGVTETYRLLFSIIRLPSVFTFCLLLLTAKVGLSAAAAPPPGWEAHGSSAPPPRWASPRQTQ